MKFKDFSRLLEQRIDKIRQTLARKGTEYSRDEDRLYNFKRAGEIFRCTPEKALAGMWLKHIVSVFDIVEKIERNKEYPTKELLNEKIGDLINYTILLEAIITENMDEKMP